MSKLSQVYYTGIVQDVYTYTVSVHSAPVRTFTVNHIVFTNKSQDSRQWKQTEIQALPLNYHTLIMQK